MKTRLIILLLALIMLAGCELNVDKSMVDSSSSNNPTTNTTTTTTTTTEYREDNATVLEEIELGVYREDYNQQECNDAGFFFCTIEQKCKNQRL